MSAVKSNRQLLLAIALTFIITFCLVLQIPIHHRRKLIVINNQPFQIPGQQSTNCLAPSVNYFDPIYQKFFINWTFHCETKEPLTTIDEFGLIQLSQNAIKLGANCSYSFIFLKDGDDDVLKYSIPKPITNQGIQLTTESTVANVSCTISKSSSTIKDPISKNTHYFIPDFNSTTNSNRPSVLVFFLESLGTGSFQRFMPETKKALASIGHFQELEGFVKPADNSFPNSMAMLTGQVAVGQSDFLKEKNITYFDNSFPFLWGDFKKSGYVTAFLEDMAFIGLFNYFSNGFKKSPVDWAPREYWLQMYPEMKSFDWAITSSYTYYCFEKNGSKLDLFLNQTRDFIKKMTIRKQSYFFWPFFSQMTHSRFDDFQFVDKQIAKFLMDIKPYLNNTVLIFAGDHGPRVYDFPQTMLGRLEERMPYVAIRIPPELDVKHPQLRTNLELNRNRLTSWFDVHRTLKDIANNDYNQTVVDATASKPINLIRGLVPMARSCRDAGIKIWYCVCDGKIHLRNDNSPEIPTDILKSKINDIAAANCENLKFMFIDAAHYEFTDNQDFLVEKLVLTVRMNLKLIKVTVVRDWNSIRTFELDSVPVWNIVEDEEELVEQICS